MKLQIIKNMSKVIIAIVLFLLIGLWLLPSSHTFPKDISWYKIAKSDFIVDFVEVGEIKAVQSMYIKAPYEWRADLQIIDMVPEGSIVEEGDFLLQFDTGYLEAALGAATSQLETNQAELRRLKAEQESRITQLQNAIKNAQYSEELANLQMEKLKYESESKRADAHLNLQKAKISLKESLTKITSQKILDSLETEKVFLKIASEKVKLQEVNKKFTELTVRAPISGLVVYYEYHTMDGRKKYKIGDKSRPGQAVIEIPNLSQMEVVFNIHEIDRDKIKISQKVELILEAFPERTFYAKIREMARLAEAAAEKSRVKNFKVNATIENTDTILKPGMTAKVRIILNELKDILSIPCTAVFEKDGEPIVFLSNKWPNSSLISLGPRNDHFVIVESGLQDGDKIAWQTPPEYAGTYQKSGYAQHIQRENNNTETITQNLDEMDKKGLDFDYATFRNKKGKRVPSQADAVNADVTKGTIKTPDGRSISLPKELLERMKSSDGKRIRESINANKVAEKQIGQIKILRTDSTAVK